MRKNFSWFGIGLVAVGTALLFNSMDLLPVDWSTFFWLALVAFGSSRVYDGFKLKLGGRIFWGSMLTLIGAYIVLSKFDVVDSFAYYFIPVLFLGISFLLMYLGKPGNLHILIPAIFFLGLGSVLLLVEYGYMYRSEVMEALKVGVPVALITFGALMIAGRRSV